MEHRRTKTKKDLPMVCAIRRNWYERRRNCNNWQIKKKSTNKWQQQALDGSLEKERVVQIQFISFVAFLLITAIVREKLTKLTL